MFPIKTTCVLTDYERIVYLLITRGHVRCNVSFLSRGAESAKTIIVRGIFNHVLLNNSDYYVARVLVVASKLGKLYV